MLKSDSRICFIFNPSADRNRSERHIDWLNREAKKRWTHFEIDITKKSDNVARLAADKASQFDIIVACGGDGTVHQVINGLAEKDTLFGVLPIGSGNDFVKSLNLNKTLPECLDIIHSQKTTSIDLIRFEGDVSGWCANTIGFGLDGWANYYASSHRKLKGHIVYVLGAIRAAFTYRGARIKLTINDKKYTDDYLMITTCNGKWEGGSFYIAPDADMTDGLMDLLLIKKISIFKILTYLPRFRWGPSPGMSGVETKACSRLRIRSNKPAAVHCDGEHLGSSISKLDLFVVRNALKVITPKNY
ncbi:MAG: diacylglycerol kinase family lipid kinase [Balneolaceae bacterium]|nr:diacylglycerol kinase family lipid kinase [Balneolaceae bacterium]